MDYNVQYLGLTKIDLIEYAFTNHYYDKILLSTVLFGYDTNQYTKVPRLFEFSQ